MDEELSMCHTFDDLVRLATHRKNEEALALLKAAEIGQKKIVELVGAIDNPTCRSGTAQFWRRLRHLAAQVRENVELARGFLEFPRNN